MRWGDWAAVGLIQSSDKLHFSNINKEIEALKDILKLNLNTLITSKGDFFTSWKISSYYIVKSHHNKYVLWKNIGNSYSILISFGSKLRYWSGWGYLVFHSSVNLFLKCVSQFRIEIFNLHPGFQNNLLLACLVNVCY